MLNRGEIWLVNLDPTVGAEIKKTRPAVIISSDSIGKLPLRMIVPLTSWQTDFSDYPWIVRIPPDHANGLKNESGADAFQLRSVDIRRLERKTGDVSVSILDEIAAAIAICVEYI